MAVSTDITVSVDYGGITYDTIGLSKTLDNYDFDELWNYAYCCANSNLIFHVGEGGNNVSYLTYQADNGHIPIELRTAEWGLKLYYPQDSALNQPDGLYMKMAWVQRTQSGSDKYISKTVQAQYYRLITEFKAPHYVYETAAPTKISNYYGAESWNDNDELLYYSSGGTLYYYDDVSSNAPIKIQIPYAEPVFLFKYNGRNYIIHYWQGMSDFYTKYNISGTPVTCSYATDYEGNTGAIAFPITSNTIYEYLDDVTGEYSSPYNEGSYIPESGGSYPRETYSETIIEYLRSFYSWDGSSSYYPQGFDQNNYFKTKSESIKFFSLAGLHFKCDKIYKPVIISGYVTGYTDDLTTASELDGWSGSTNHDIPDVPPGPTPPGPGPYDDDPWSGATFAGTGVGGAGAFAKCYYMTSTELANLRSWMNSINVPEGFDPMQQIIGLSQVPVALSGSGPENVVFVNSSAVYDPGVTTRAVDTGVATQQAMGTPISYYLGSVDIVRRMQERGEPYLDYDCQIELYLPLIGMFSLDTQAVMGRTISAYAVLDPVSGTLAAYAYVSKDGQNLPVAYGSTTIGVDLPISAQQLSVSRAALKQANAQLGASLLSGALTMLAAASSGKASGTGAKTSTGSSGLSAAGIREAGSDYMKASQVGNVFGDFMNWGRTIRQLSYGNNTAIAGSFGGSTAQWSYPFTPYVKIIRPRYEKPSNYNHSQGVPCVQTKTIGSCTGFIQCIGADVSGITGATDLELQAIQAALSNGIYAGGGQ